MILHKLTLVSTSNFYDDIGGIRRELQSFYKSGRNIHTEIDNNWDNQCQLEKSDKQWHCLVNNNVPDKALGKQ